MTNKEAISILKNTAFLATSTSFQSIEEAVEIAVKALEEQEVNASWEYAYKVSLSMDNEKAQKPEPCEDAVSREAVSKWLKQYGQDVLHGKYKFSLMYIWKNLMDLPSVTPKLEPCEDAVSRADVVGMLEMYPFTEYSEYEAAREVVKRLPSVTPKLSNIDFLMPESELVFYDNDHGFCINTQDVLEHIRGYMQ